MKIINLKINDRVYKYFMWFLERFDKDEIQIINEDDEFLSVKEYLRKELDNLEKGEAEFISIDELDNALEETIRKNEG